MPSNEGFDDVETREGSGNNVRNVRRKCDLLMNFFKGRNSLSMDVRGWDLDSLLLE